MIDDDIAEERVEDEVDEDVEVAEPVSPTEIPDMDDIDPKLAQDPEATYQVEER